MSQYRVQILIRSTLGTPLVGDTIFGHVCWGILRTGGENNLKDFLVRCEENPFYFAVSSAFPSNMLPVPILTPLKEVMASNTSQYGKKKKNKKRKYIPSNTLLQQKEPLNPERLNQILETTEETYAFQSLPHLHNTINRITGTTEEPTGLFSSNEIALTAKDTTAIKKTFADIYVVSDESLDAVHDLLYHAFLFGYGADASAGKGWIEITDIAEIQFPTSGNRFIALGPFIPTEIERTQISNFTYELFLRKGKVGPEFVHIYNPFKKPMLFYREGSTFALSERKCVVGTVLTGIHTEAFIRHAAHTPILSFLLEV